MTTPHWFPILITLISGGFAAVSAGSTPPTDASSDSSSSQDSAHIADWVVGLGGPFKVGHWTPVRLTLEGGTKGFAGEVEFVLPDGDGVPTRMRAAQEMSIRIAPGQRWTGWRYVKLGQTLGKIRILLRDEAGRVLDEQVADDLAPVPSTCHWVLTSGVDIGAEDAAALAARAGGRPLVTSRLDAPEQFPDRWYGYEGLNVLLVPTGTTNPLERVSDAQFAALARWLELGGRLVVSASTRAALLWEPGQRFYDFRPGEFQELDEHWKASGLESYARASERLTDSDTTSLAIFSDLRGRIVCLEGAGGLNDRPLITRYPFGFGQITYVALDLDMPPLSEWSERPRLLARLLQPGNETDESRGGQEGLGQVAHVGFEDLTGQLRAALDQFSGVTLVRFSWIAAILVIYVILLGPADFFGLRKVRRPHWTWFTFPLIVIAFCGLAVGLADRWKGSQLKVNQVDIVDVDVERAVVRGITWANIYSPRSVTMDLRHEPSPAVDTAHPASALFSWQGLPGNGLGGMNSNATVHVMSDEYTILGEQKTTDAWQTVILKMPIPTSSTKGLVSRWWAETKPLETSQLTTRSGSLRGVVVNPLNVELTNGAVYFAGRLFRLKYKLAPGDSVNLEDEFDVEAELSLDWQLTRRELVGSTEVNTTWDRQDVTDMPRIIEMLMFHATAGGRSYCELTHDYQGFVDLSEHLQLRRAILLGRSKTPASHLTNRDQSLDGHMHAQWTYYRILLPVQREQTP